MPDTLKPFYEKATLVAATNDISCLILGENGTGKENLAKFIHKSSQRKSKPFIAVNCAAFTDELLRSELFGYEKGAFTGADKLTKGVFEESDGGTIFLDEIGDISPKMQVSLLRVLQEKRIQRVGRSNDIMIDVRVIAATNKELEEMCETERFRWDLFLDLQPLQ
ncbi:MAG: sigma-54 factor interaction domain-containing protein [Bacteroidales bacterium]|nr:sigma-54 factor interaction domain-containing protein [Bacteroidales bacterium]